MKSMESPLGISRSEYIAGVRLCPSHPAFAGTYEDWARATIEVIRKLSEQRVGAQPARRVTSKR
jgi:capsid portal protein